jgi:hypothetical protein
MQLPVDARDAPFKPKYIDEETPMFSRWFEWGRRPDGTVDLQGGNNGSDEIFVGLPPEKAIAIIAARDKFCDTLLEILNG